MASTDLEMCNMALSHVGQDEISALSSTGSKSQRACHELFEQAVRYVLTQKKWRCSTSRDSLSTKDGTPEYGYSAFYTISTLEGTPLKVWDVRASSLKDRDQNDLFWEVEEGNIICDADDGIKVQYTKRVDDANIDDHVVEVIVWRLAMLLAMPLTQNRALKRECQDTYMRVLADTAAMDQQGRNKPLRVNRVLNARMSGGNSRIGPYV